MLEGPKMPAGRGVSGLEADDKDKFYCGDRTSGKVLAMKRTE
jgi:hypothetical protein